MPKKQSDVSAQVNQGTLLANSQSADNMNDNDRSFKCSVM